MSELDWLERARCKGREPDVFFVRGAAKARRAVNICGKCPVRSECLDYADEHEIEYGVWGGLTERQRRARHREMTRVAV